MQRVDRLAPIGLAHSISKTEAHTAAPETSAHHFAAALRNQPRGALIAGVDPQPADRDAEPVAQADQEVDVRDAPYPPRDGAARLITQGSSKVAGPAPTRD